MRKLITIILIFVCSKSFAQVYQLMPQYGYQANRMVFDSTLQIPTTCGVPTLKSVQFTTRRAAIAFDSCNNRFYQYNPKTLAWSVVSGGGGSTDTTSLSNRINLKIDSLKRSSDSIYAYKNSQWVYQYSESDTSKVVIAQVHNATGTTLLKGEVVYLFGANGSVASVKRANNKQDSTSSKTFGIVRRDIAAGGTGYITTQGQIEKLNLGSYTEGDIIWLDSIDGQFTKVKPTAPYHQVFLGVVERANNGNGLAYVKPQNGYELGELHNVSVNGNPNNAILYFDSTSRLWKGKVIDSFSVPKTDTTSLSNRINQKLSASDTISLSNRINAKLSASDTTSLSNRINTKLNITDTSFFDRKQLAAYSFMANSTSAAANSVATYFKDTSGSYTGTPAWNGTAPTTLTATYRWTRIGKRVDLNITLVYTTAGSANSNLTLPLPSDAPTPAEPSGATSNSNFLYPAYGMMNANLTTLTNAAFRGGIRKNSGGTGYEFHINFTGTPIIVYVNSTYWTN